MIPLPLLPLGVGIGIASLVMIMSTRRVNLVGNCWGHATEG